MGKRNVVAPASDNPLAAELAELGIVLGADGKAPIKLKTGLTIGDFGGRKDEICRCDPLIAVRIVRRGYAEPWTDDEVEAGAVEPS